MEASCMVGLYYKREATYDEDEKMMMMNMGSRHQDGHDGYISESSTSSSFNESNTSTESSSSDLLDDDASSSSSSSSSPSNNGPLYELSELMDQLPIKRGLSKFYQGKSQSFTSLARVTSLEDLAKKESAYQRKLKACKSYGGGLNNFRSYTQPKATISKKAHSKGSFSSLSCLSRKGSFTGTSRPPLSHVKRS